MDHTRPGARAAFCRLKFAKIRSLVFGNRAITNNAASFHRLYATDDQEALLRIRDEEAEANRERTGKDLGKIGRSRDLLIDLRLPRRSCQTQDASRYIFFSAMFINDLCSFLLDPYDAFWSLASARRSIRTKES